MTGVLGVRENPSQPYAAALVGTVRERHLLLVLDNCERLVDACARLIEEILRGAPNVCVLTTSRVTLRVPGEVSRAVRPLAWPPHNSVRALDHIQHYASVRLFEERALAVEPQFAVTHQNVSALVEICQRLDGMPLAIELAAARVTVLSLEQILTRLDNGSDC